MLLGIFSTNFLHSLWYLLKSLSCESSIEVKIYLLSILLLLNILILYNLKEKKAREGSTK